MCMHFISRNNVVSLWEPRHCKAIAFGSNVGLEMSTNYVCMLNSPWIATGIINSGNSVQAGNKLWSWWSVLANGKVKWEDLDVV
jgi:hypothetical protein